MEREGSLSWPTQSWGGGGRGRGHEEGPAGQWGRDTRRGLRWEAQHLRGRWAGTPRQELMLQEPGRRRAQAARRDGIAGPQGAAGLQPRQALPAGVLQTLPAARAVEPTRSVPQMTLGFMELLTPRTPKT